MIINYWWSLLFYVSFYLKNIPNKANKCVALSVFISPQFISLISNQKTLFDLSGMKYNCCHSQPSASEQTADLIDVVGNFFNFALAQNNFALDRTTVCESTLILMYVGDASVSMSTPGKRCREASPTYSFT